MGVENYVKKYGLRNYRGSKEYSENADYRKIRNGGCKKVPRDILKELAKVANSWKDDPDKLSLLNHPYALYQDEERWRGDMTSFLRPERTRKEPIKKIKK